MVQIFEEESVGGRLGEAFGSGISSGLDLLIQNKVNRLQERQKSFQEMFKEQEAVQSNVAKFLKDIGSGDVFDPDDRLKMGELARSNMENGMAPSMAILNAYQQLADEDIEKQKPSAQRSGVISRGAKERKENLEKTRQERQQAYEEGPSPVKEPGAFGRGVVSSPILNLLRQMGSPEIAALDVSKGGLKRLTEPATGPYEEEKTEKARKTKELGKGVGDLAALELIPFGEALRFFAPYVRRTFGKVAQRFGKVAQRFGKEAPEIAKTFEKFVKREKIDLSKLAKKDAAESRKFLKATRAFEENYPKISEQLESREALKKAGKRKGVPQEAAREAERKAQSVAREEPKRDTTKAKREAVKSEAKKDLDSAKEKYIEATKRRRRIQDDLKLKTENVSKSDLERAKVLEKEAQETYKNLSKQARVGKKQPTSYERQKRIFTTLNEVQDLANSVEEPFQQGFKKIKDRFLKEGDFAKEVKEAVRKKELPEVAKDAFLKRNEEYAKRIMNRLENVQKDLKGTKNIQEALARKREMEMLRDLLDMQKQKLKVGKRRNSLQRIDKLMRETDKFMKQEKLSEKTLKSAQKAQEEFGQKLQGFIKKTANMTEPEAQREAKVFGKSIKDAISKASNWSPASEIQKQLKKADLNISKKFINSALRKAGLTGFGGSIPFAMFLWKKNKNRSQVSTIKNYLKKKDRMGLQRYLNKLKKDGTSQSQINKNLKAARAA